MRSSHNYTYMNMTNIKTIKKDTREYMISQKWVLELIDELFPCEQLRDLKARITG